MPGWINRMRVFGITVGFFSVVLQDIAIRNALDQNRHALQHFMKLGSDWDDLEIGDDSDHAHADALSSTLTTTVSSYQVLTRANIETQRQILIDHVADTLAVELDHAESMLCSHRWRSTDLVEAYLNSETNPVVGSGTGPPLAGGTAVCQTAFCGEHPRSQTTALSCGHVFCHDCWRSVASSVMNSGRVAVLARCPGVDQPASGAGELRKCQLKIPSRVLIRFLNRAQIGKYRRWLIEDFVDGSVSLRWCIQPLCDRVISCQNPNEVVTCHCRMTFCFGCSIADHRPAPCDLVRKWMARVTSDSETEKWIKSRTKKCPKCSVPIEKNRACNHMVCSNCSMHFCWLCKMPWSQHDVQHYGFYRCNLYEAKETQIDNDAENVEAAMATQQMQKYTFYLNRHLHQLQAEREIVLLKSQIEADEVKSGIGYDRILPVLDHLIKARRFLAWSYCLAYYLGAGPYKRLVEHQQGVLESITEKLQSALTMAKSKIAVKRSSGQRHPKRLQIVDQAAESDLIQLGAAVYRFTTRLLHNLSVDNSHALSEADSHTDRWACTVCTSEVVDDATYCLVCGACRKHSERECRVPNCKNPMTPDFLPPGEALGQQ